MMWTFWKKPDRTLSDAAGVIPMPRGDQLTPRLMPVTILLLALLHCANALFIFHFYTTNAEHEAETRDATATLLAEQASHALTAVDATVETLAVKLRPDLFAGRMTVADQAVLMAESARVNQVRQILVLDNIGTVVLDSYQFPPEQRNLASQGFYNYHAGHSTNDLYIGKLIFRANVSPYFNVSRGIYDDHGTLIGVAVALVEPTHLIGIGTTSSVVQSALLAHDDDGSILAGDTSKPGEIGPETTVSGLTAKYPPELVTTRQVGAFPLQMVVTGTPPTASAAFRNFILFDILIMSLVTLVALTMARKLRNEALARGTAEDRLRDAIESSPAGFALYDAEDRLVMSNEHYLDYFPPAIRPVIRPGTPFETTIRLIADDKEWGEGTPDRAAMIERRLASHRDAADELLQHLRDGRWLLTRERRTKEGGTTCFFTDVTTMKAQEDALRRSEKMERQARENAERADRTKSSFLATMSHELRTPLNAVIGFSQITEQGMFGPQPARYREYATLIRRSGEHLLTIINDILDIAKLQSGKTELHLETTILAPIIDETVRLVMPRAEAAELTLTQRLAPSLPLVRVDPTRIRQVLLNLLSNAIKFTPSGGRITVEACAWEDSVTVSVTDTGIGMAERDIPKALEPFGQISSALTRAQEGTGLGLPLSKSLVELHGGLFAIESHLGRGTTVTITLPTTMADNAAKDALQRSVG